jgi:hypothetical protein
MPAKKHACNLDETNMARKGLTASLGELYM